MILSVRHTLKSRYREWEVLSTTMLDVAELMAIQEEHGYSYAGYGFWGDLVDIVDGVYFYRWHCAACCD